MNVLFVRTRPLTGAESSTIRAVSTVKTLLEAGCQVTVLTTDIDGGAVHPQLLQLGADFVFVPMAGAYSSVRDVKSTPGTKKGSPLKKLVVWLKKLYRGLNVIDPLKMALPNARKIMDKLMPEYDAVISCSDPKSSHLLAQQVLKNGVQCRKYIEIWGDPLTTDISRKFVMPRSYVKKVEKDILKPANLVLYVSPTTLEEQQRLFPAQAGKMDLLRPTYSEKRPGNPVERIETVGYFGDYTSNIRNILPLYQALRESGLKAVFCGSSDVQLEQTQAIEIHGRMPRQEVAVYEDAADVLVCLGNRTGKQIPGKIYQYAATSKAILVINDGELELERYFGQYDRFVFCQNNKQSIAQALEALKNGPCGQWEPVEDFYYKTQVEQIKRMLQA